MKSLLLPLVTLMIGVAAISAQQINLNYFLPETEYDPQIPTPSAWLGSEIGEWHCSHDQLTGYIKFLAAAGNRTKWLEYGRSHENRPLGCLIITSPENLKNLDNIKLQRRQLVSPEKSGKTDPAKIPAVCYMGYSVHGNEASGANAALLVAYYLSAAKNATIDSILNSTVFLLDPCFNPDGMQKFSNWVNSHKAQNSSTDPIGDEYNEPWPRSRTNHYGFDLNRDWLVARQPETPGRVALFQEWRPNILTDHHEMGSNATFFFQPGVPSRVNPITPKQNQELTDKITQFHARLLSKNGIPFYRKENFDDFYYGKGSTYPDAKGGMGILFEQASSRGTAQDTENGVLTFPYSVRNQVFASLATIRAVFELRVELNEYLRKFYQTALQEAAQKDCRGYVFEDGTDRARDFLQLLGLHGIKVVQPAKDLVLEGHTYHMGTTFFVPCDQPEYRLVRAIFERPTQFQDSIFYDISAWTLPDAFGIKWASVQQKDYKSSDYRDQIALTSLHPPSILGPELPYGYAVSPEQDKFPNWTAQLLLSGIRVKMATEPFELDGISYARGTIVVLQDRQVVLPETIHQKMNKILSEGAHLQLIQKGGSEKGPDLGSSKFQVLRQPKIALLSGEGVTVSDFGEIWHLLDIQLKIPATVVDISRWISSSWNSYNVVILPDGNYGSLNGEKMRQFISEGGTVIAMGKALQWLKNSGLAAVEYKKPGAQLKQKASYETLEEDKAARALPGAIFEAELDLTHPLCFGYQDARIPVFVGDTNFVQPAKNPYTCPVRLSSKPLLAGYVHPDILKIIPGAAAVQVYGVGKGKIIGFSILPNFRAFWYGTNRLLTNAILFGNIINPEGAERK